jgi:hypothetical protein
MTTALLGNVLGGVGAVTILAAYAYQTLLHRPADALYYTGNLVGASLLAVSLTIHFNLSALLLEIAWAAIALYGLIGKLRAREG